MSVLPDDHYLYEEINKIVFYDTPISKKGTPGYIVAIISGDSTYVLSFGQRSIQDKSKIQPSDRFQIGSLSKLFTATIAARLDRMGMISMSKSITNQIPNECRSEIMSDISLKDLPSHQSRLQKYPMNIGRTQSDLTQPYHNYRMEQLYTYLSTDLKISREPIYSHLNYALAELVLEQITGESFPNLATQYLFKELGMSQSAFEAKPSNLVKGINRGSRDAEPWEFASFLASEGATSSLNDLVRFLRWNLSNEHSVTTQEVIDILHNPIGDTFPGEGIETCLGWHRYYPKKKWPVHVHTGQTSGHHSYIAFCKRSQTGVIILSNSANGTYELGALILRMINHNWKSK